MRLPINCTFLEYYSAMCPNNQIYLLWSCRHERPLVSITSKLFQLFTWISRYLVCSSKYFFILIILLTAVCLWFQSSISLSEKVFISIKFKSNMYTYTYVYTYVDSGMFQVLTYEHKYYLVLRLYVQHIHGLWKWKRVCMGSSWLDYLRRNYRLLY